MRRLGSSLASAGVCVACATGGSAWMAEPLDSAYEPILEEREARPVEANDASEPPAELAPPRSSRESPDEPPGSLPRADDRIVAAGGRALGTFRNTYYDFPNEGDYEGAQVALKNAKCDTVASVTRGFFEAVCVQGSGTLKKGSTVSFAKRDCACAETCPKTQQKICFDELDPKEFPWGRGATGKAITPLLTVAVDPDAIPLGTALYIPELDGLPRDIDGTSRHDGCFIAQDKGLKVKGQHVDIFTGHASITALWNRMVPSNRGVTVVVDSPRCARVAP
ncbi:MAG TPA: 3D domain-containing protein [Polyangiaceae bacterium]